MRPRNALALAASIISFGALSSTIGVGALPTSSLPAYGVTSGNGSQMTVAQLGDVDGDHINDYAVGMPYADANGADSGIVYVFLGRAGALPPTPAAIDLAAASFRIVGHGGELLGFAVSGGDLNGDGRADIALGAPMAAGPGKAAAGAVYVVFGSAAPHDVSTTALSLQGYTNDPVNPNTNWPTALGSRYEGFQVNSHTGTAVAVVPDVNGDHIGDLAVGMPDASLHRPGGGGAAVLYGKPQGVHINLADLWSAGYPYYFHVDFPSLDNQHVGESVAGVPDMTGDGWPDIAIGAPQADYNGVDSGSVWIISGHLPPIGPGCTGMNVDATCPWIRLNGLTAAQGYRIDGAAPGDGLGSSLAGAGDQNGDGLPDLAIGASAASPSGRSNAGTVFVVPGQQGSATRNLAAPAPAAAHRRSHGRSRPGRCARGRRRHGRRRSRRPARRRPRRVGLRGRRLPAARRAGHGLRPRAGGSQRRAWPRPRAGRRPAAPSPAGLRSTATAPTR